jgi:hypothetical protein
LATNVPPGFKTDSVIFNAYDERGMNGKEKCSQEFELIKIQSGRKLEIEECKKGP